MAGLAVDLARIDATVAELTARPAADPDLAARLDEVAASVQALSERPVADQTLASRVDALDGHVASLAEIRTTLQELEARPVGSPELDARVARIEIDLAQRPVDTPGAAEVERLAARLETTADEQAGLAAAVEELGARLEAVAQPDDRIGDATARLDELGAGLAAIQVEVASLAQSVTPTVRVVELASRIDELTSELAAHESSAAKLEDVERMLPSEVVTPADLSQALGRLREELESATGPAPSDPRIEHLLADVASLRVDRGPDERIDVLAQELGAMRAELVHVTGATGTPDPELPKQLDVLAERIEQVAGDVGAPVELTARLDDLERRLPAEIVTPADLAHALAEARC